MKKIAVLTSGGDAPGMNACLRAIVKKGLASNLEVLGIIDGYQGMIEGRSKMLLYSDVNNIIHQGGTILGTARSKEFRSPEGRKKASAFLRDQNVEALIVIGGDGSFAGANALSNEMDIPIVGLPGTIDNDIYGTDFTIGYSTALQTCVDAIDKIRDTASSHNRIFFVEVMGRDAGFIALNAAIAGGADDVLIPEEHSNIQALAENLKRINLGKRSAIVIVAEGDDAGGAHEIIKKVTPYMEGFEMRCSILGHIQRGGSPVVPDRILATKLGYAAVEGLIHGKTNVMYGVNGEDVVPFDLHKCIKLHSSPDITKLELIRQLRTKSRE